MKETAKKFLSLILALLMVMPMCTVAFADANGVILPPEEAIEIVEEPIEEPAEEPIEEPVEEPIEEPVEEPAEEPVEEPIEEPVEEPIEEPVEEPAEEEILDSEVLLPEGVVGMPEGYALSAEEQEFKAIVAEQLETIEAAVPGEDYVEQQVVMMADSMEYALKAAEAYGGKLLSWGHGIAVVELGTISTLEAVTLAVSSDFPLPPVEPNYIYTVEPIQDEPAENLGDMSLNSVGERVPVTPTWKDWYDGLVNDGDPETEPDPFIAVPSSRANSEYQWMHDAVNSFEAWGSSTGKGAVVAVIDSGIDTTHPDLQGDGKVTCIPVTYDEPQYDGDYFIGYEEVTLPTEPIGDHGTHVAGIIGANMGNGIGGAGIAPDASLLSIRVNHDPGSMWLSAVAMGVDLAVEAGADVINLSLGGYSNSAAMEYSITQAVDAGVTVVVSMGNDGSNVMQYPAGYDNVIAVAATDIAGKVAGFSTVGKWADIAAPGVDIYAPTSTHEDDPADYENVWESPDTNPYEWMNGTSMATPVVAGAAALYIAKMEGDVTPEQVAAKLKKSVNKSDSKDIGAGIVDCAKLFAGDKIAPIIQVIESVGGEHTPISTKTLNYWNHFIEIYPGKNSTNGDMIVYTTDGSTPAVKNGVITNGEIYDEENWIVPAVEFQGKAGKKVTVKALCVSAQGDVSKVASANWTFGYDPFPMVMDIRTEKGWKAVENPYTNDVDIVDRLYNLDLAAGKSLQLYATLYSSSDWDGNLIADCRQDIEWKINYSNLPSATLKNGKLTTKAGETGDITICAESVADPSVSATVTVTVKSDAPIGTLKLDQSKVTLGYRYNEAETVQLNIATLLGTDKAVIDPADRDFLWTSSNPAVATVNRDGFVVAQGAGTANITCKALDGSNKSAKCKITVEQRPEAISIIGFDTAPCYEKKATVSLKAELFPKNVKNKQVTWEVDDLAAKFGITVSTSGKVTVPAMTDAYLTGLLEDGVVTMDDMDAMASRDGTITVIARSVDDPGIATAHYIYMREKATQVTITPVDEEYLRWWQWDKKGETITGVTLYTVDLLPEVVGEDFAALNETEVYLLAEADNLCYVDVVSSKPNVASVQEDWIWYEGTWRYGWVVTAHAPGNTKITATATDGSKKKATFNIDVINPPSDLTITSAEIPASLMGEEVYSLGAGKNIAFKAALGDAYGKLGKLAVEWNLDVVPTAVFYHYDEETDWEGYCTLPIIEAAELLGNDYLLDAAYMINDLAYELQDNGYFTVDQKGKVSTKKQISAYYEEMNALMRQAMEDSNQYYEMKLYLYGRLYSASVEGWCYDYATVVFNPSLMTYLTPEYKTVELPTDVRDYVYLYYDGFYGSDDFWYYTPFEITSSKPEVAAVLEDDMWTSGWGGFAELPIITGEPGTAKITVKATDGSKKSCTFTVKVMDWED